MNAPFDTGKNHLVGTIGVMPNARNQSRGDKTEELVNRNKIVRAISAIVGTMCSFGATGSTVNGMPTEKSDIDLFLVVDRTQIRQLVDKIHGLQTFQLPSNKVLTAFEEGAIDILFLYGELENIPVNLEIYSTNSTQQILSLNQVNVRRFRTRLTATNAIFYNCLGEGISVAIKQQPFAEGSISTIPVAIVRGNFKYIGNHLDKILTGRLYEDKHNVELNIRDCMRSLVKDAIDANLFSDDCILNLLANRAKFTESMREHYRALAHKLLNQG